MRIGPLKQLLNFLRSEVGATEVGLTSQGDEAPSGKDVVALGLPRGQSLWARFAEPPRKKEAIRARIEVIAQSFSHLLELEATRGRIRRRSPTAELRITLKRLASSAAARDAIVLDTRSPIVWGAASGLSAEALGRPKLTLVGRDDRTDEAPGTAAQQQRIALSRRVIREVRALPEIAQLPRGAHLRRSTRAGQVGYLVRSFASIYLLVLVYADPIDELRAEREVARSLSTIESLVLSLPPREPEDGSTRSSEARKRR
jgi:hypothetical protein